MTRHPPSLHGVLRDEFPRFLGTTRVLRLPAILPPSLRLSLARGYLAALACSLSAGPERGAGEPGNWSRRPIAPLMTLRRRQDLPGSWEALRMHAVLSDPGGLTGSRRNEPDSVAFRLVNTVGHHILTLSRLNHTARMLAVYASRFGSLRPVQDSLAACWLGTCRTGLSPAGLHTRISRRHRFLLSFRARLHLAH
jgi:hypothetical protein